MSNIIPLDTVINVIERDELAFPPEPSLVIVEHNSRKYCPHEHLNIFRHNRNCFCKDCGATLDAFDVLIKFASKESNTITQIKWLQYQLKDMEQEKEKLKSQISYLKSQKRKLA